MIHTDPSSKQKQPFTSELRGILGKSICEFYPCKQANGYECGFEMSGCSKLPTIDLALSAIQSLRLKDLPKDLFFGKDFNEDSNCDFNYVKGWNDYKAKLFKEIGL